MSLLTLMVVLLSFHLGLTNEEHFESSAFSTRTDGEEEPTYPDTQDGETDMRLAHAVGMDTCVVTIAHATTDECLMSNCRMSDDGLTHAFSPVRNSVRISKTVANTSLM